MSIRSDFQKAIVEVRKDISEGEGYLKWALDEVERHLSINPPAPTPALAAEPEEAAEETQAPAEDDEPEEKPAARRKTAN